MDSREAAPATPTAALPAPARTRAHHRTIRSRFLITPFKYSRSPEETVKPGFTPAVLSLLLLAAAPAPLVVGSVRDQDGAPIAGASVSGAGSWTRTDAAGTFALPAEASAITVSCDYCVSVTLPVRGDQPVVVFVRRYEAVRLESPSRDDVASLPYAHAEQIVSLTPFMVLEGHSRALPGPIVADRGHSPRGALVVDDGIPSYDIVTGESPFYAFPASSLQQFAWRGEGDAFLYGDLAGGGTLDVNTHAQPEGNGVAVSGNEGGAHVAASTPSSQWSLGASRDGNDARSRADAAVNIPIGSGVAGVQAVAWTDRLAPDEDSRIASSAAMARIFFHHAGDVTVDAAATAAGGDYGASTYANAYGARWSDASITAGAMDNARIAIFGDVSARDSTGRYDDVSQWFTGAANAISQVHADVGAQTSGDAYAMRVGLGGFDIHDETASGANQWALPATAVLPSFDGSYRIDPHWTLAVDSGSSYTLSTLVQDFYYSGGRAQIARAFDADPTLTYGDLQRVRVSLTWPLGGSLAWQIAPDVAVRAWLFRPYGLPVSGSYWATYQTPGFRADAIYRRDILDGAGDEHLDASISVPLGGALRVFAGTERRARVRYLTAGLRFGS
jgi:hypothetical protein